MAVRAMRRHFHLRRLHSLAGVVPLGVFLVEHLWTNAHTLYGRASFDRAVGDIQSLPALLALEIVGIALPLLFHAGYGLVIAAQGSVNVGRYPHPRNWMYVLQRATGLVALAFIALHLAQFRLRKSTGVLAWQDFYHQIGVQLDARWVYAAYVLGVTATIVHFANGLWLAGNTWGITLTTRAMRRSAWVCGLAGLALWLVGIDTLWHFTVRCGGVVPLPAQHVELLCAGVR